MRKSKNKKIIIALFVLIVIGILLIVNRTQVYTLARNTVRNILRLTEDEATEETKVYCEVTDPANGKTDVFVEFQNPKGIEKLIIGEDIIETKGKTKVAIDRKLNEGEVYQIKVKLNGEDKEELYTGVASRTLPTIILANADTNGDGTTKTVEVKSVEHKNIKKYYSLDDGQNWSEYTEETKVLQVKEAENRTITAKVEAKEGKFINVDNAERVPLIVSESLITAVRDANIINNDRYYRIAVKDKEYYTHIYIEKNSLTLESSKTYGSASDVGTANANAQCMVIVKVNGDLTINNGVTLTAYNTTYGGPKGMLVCATGTITNNGAISMTARGAKAVGENVYLWKNISEGQTINYEFVPVSGAGGASRRACNSAGQSAGANGTGRQTGGGGSGQSGGGCKVAYSGAGSAGTSYSGGTGGRRILQQLGKYSFWRSRNW